MAAPEHTAVVEQVLSVEPRSTSDRWRKFVLQLVLCDRDLKTVAAWARHVGVSRTVLRESCRMVRVSPHDARDFARMLRAILRSGREWRPEHVLNVADARTLRKLELRSGFEGAAARCPPSLEQFFERQAWIPPDAAALLRVLPAPHATD